jgi:hypothetical protein
MLIPSCLKASNAVTVFELTSKNRASVQIGELCRPIHVMFILGSPSESPANMTPPNFVAGLTRLPCASNDRDPVAYMQIPLPVITRFCRSAECP